MKFLSKECEERGATIIYATHIFDGLENWPSHMVRAESYVLLYLDLLKKVVILKIIILFEAIRGSWEVAISNANGQGKGDQQYVINGKF